MSDLHHELAPRILPVVLANLTTLYPYHDIHLTRAGEPPHDPIAAHPAFGNSFDWHSSVHSHWTALQLIAHFEGERGEKPAELDRLSSVVAEHLAPAKLAAETAYLAEHPSYERPYGWAWAMLLAAASEEPALRVMAETIASATARWLRILPFPVRHGVHSNTAFAMGLLHDAATTLRFDELRLALQERARDWFGNDRDWPQRWERSGSDFLSPGLAEADLMRRVLASQEFTAWWERFVPALDERAPFVTAVDVPSVTDGHIVHLHGLNFSRAAALARIAETLGTPSLLVSAHALYVASSERAVTGHYNETHWLPTFAWDAAVSIDNARERLRSG